MVTIRDASYKFQLILVTANILVYFSFFEKISPIKRLCHFKEMTTLNFTVISHKHYDNTLHKILPCDNPQHKTLL